MQLSTDWSTMQSVDSPICTVSESSQEQDRYLNLSHLSSPKHINTLVHSIDMAEDRRSERAYTALPERYLTLVESQEDFADTCSSFEEEATSKKDLLFEARWTKVRSLPRVPEDHIYAKIEVSLCVHHPHIAL